MAVQIMYKQTRISLEENYASCFNEIQNVER